MHTPMILFYFFQFCDVAKVVMMITRRFSQKWLHAKYQSKKKIKTSFYIFGYLFSNHVYEDGDLKFFLDQINTFKIL
jgi:hypothetical protein